MSDEWNWGVVDFLEVLVEKKWMNFFYGIGMVWYCGIFVLGVVWLFKGGVFRVEYIGLFFFVINYVFGVRGI